ncbi:LysR family transcriptional regulator [Streptomyces sp. NPDC056161]|uniref:LysR family transcriptional regulator n=1 Tax=Streptomyces sp. NPDC056161 TaxID=3345732 RepID=UPI0035DE5459
MTRLELKHFRLLLAIADAGSLSAAAKQLGYSQPAITQQVRQLERSIVKTPLLVRSRSGVRFTMAGEVLLRRGRAILDVAALATAEVEAIVGSQVGQIRVASFPSAVSTLLPGALAAVRTVHPGMSFSLVEAETERALELLRRGECDLAVVYEWVVDADGPRPGLEPAAGAMRRTLIDETVYVALPAGHAWAEQSRVRLADLAGEVWIAGCPTCRRNLLDLCARVGISPVIGFETDDYVAVQRLVESGLGVALLTDLMVSAAPGRDRLVLRPVLPLTRRVVSVVASKDALRTPGIRHLIACLRDTADSRAFGPETGRAYRSARSYRSAVIGTC